MTDFSTVTESEMQDWFRRLSTMIVSASNQSQEIKRLQEDFSIANQRLSDLASDNAKLKGEVADTWRLMQEVERERDTAKAEVANLQAQNEAARNELQRTVQDYDGRLQQAHDALAQRDQRIAQLEQQVTEAQGRGDRAEQEAAQVKRDLENANSSVRYWTGRCEEAERGLDITRNTVNDQAKAIQGLTEKLTAVQSKVAEFRSMFEEPKAAPEPVQPETSNAPYDWGMGRSVG